jgi:hypothetical protein
VWFPDAFAGTMAQLLCALEEGTEPETSGRDNLLEVLCGYRSNSQTAGFQVGPESDC